MEVATAGWSGEGAFTQRLIEALKAVEPIAFLRIEDAPATRSEADYNFISNEIFVRFQVTPRRQPFRRFGVLPGSRAVLQKKMTLAELDGALAAMEGIGPPEYADEGMLQYLKAERIVPPYQTRGYKLVELVRIYEVGAEPGR